MKKFTLVLTFLWLFCNASAQIKTPQGKIVKNLKLPKIGSKQYTMKEELSIGESRNDDNYYFSKISALYVDNRENIYLIEGNERQVRLFDKDGKFIRKFGRKGRGPGEFLYPTYVYVNDSIIYVVDSGNRKISSYFIDGTFLTDLRVDVGATPGAVVIDSVGNYILFCIKFTVQGDMCKIVRINAKGEIISESENLPWQKRKFIFTENGTMGVPSPFAPCGYISYNKYTNFIYYGFSDNYEITVLDKNFNNVMIIEKQASPIKIQGKDKKDYIQSYMEKGRVKQREDFYRWRKKYIKFPKYHPFFDGMWINDKGNLLVKRITNDKNIHLDVFNKDGIYIEEIVLIPSKDENIVFDSIFNEYTIFVKNYVYGIGKTIDGIILFKKYSLISRD